MLEVVELVKAAGYLGVFGIIFAESGIFLGLFLPGDSFLFTAGFLASQGFLEIIPLLLLSFTAAILGDSFGYAFGKKVGPAIFRRENSIFFRKDYIEKARIFYEKYGKKTIVLARFIPIVRTFAPILAGVGRMNYRIFLIYNITGGLLWGVGVTLLGYFLGNAIPGVDRYLLPIVGLIILISISPGIFHYLKHRRAKSILNKEKAAP